MRQETDVTTQTQASRPLKEAFFVQTTTPDEQSTFIDETSNLGRKMPYTKPDAVCGMRVTTAVVSFHMTRFTNRSREIALANRLELRRGALERIERRAAGHLAALTSNNLIVELEEDTYTVLISRDENGVASLDMPDSGEDPIVTLSKRGTRVTVYLKAARGEKVLGYSFQGHLGRPDSQESLLRVVSRALNMISGLAYFRMVAGIETVTVPPSPTRYLAVRPTLKASDRARKTVGLRLWSGDAAPVLLHQFEVDIEADLVQANPVSGRILFHITPPAGQEEAFAPYRDLVADAALTMVTRELSPSEVADLVYSIALGELGAGDVERLQNAVATLPGFDVNPAQWVPIAETPAA